MTKRKKPVIVSLLPFICSGLSFLGLFIVLFQEGTIKFPSPVPKENVRLENAINSVSSVTHSVLPDALEESGTIQNAEISAEQISREEQKVTVFVNANDIASRASLSPYHIRWPMLLEDVPQDGYPVYNSLMNIVETWNPDIVEPPTTFVETLQHFNYSDPAERAVAAKFRDAELPFKIYNSPEIDHVVDLWTDEYLTEQLDGKHAHVEKSDNNHFMYWTAKNGRWGKLANWVPPTEIISDMSFPDWLQLAKLADQNKLKNDSIHYYFMSSANPGDRGRSFVARDMNMFSTGAENFFITNVKANKGIQCRFGMRGIIAESHYDGGRNMVAMLKGNKRYIIAPPRACDKLGIISDRDHPSYRHSVIDWSDMNQARSSGFDTVPAIDTIVREGEVLYIPSYWFHYIISLEYSIQCNSRSGSPPNGEGQEEIEKCMGSAMTNLREYNRESGHKKGKNKGKKVKDHN